MELWAAQLRQERLRQGLHQREVAARMGLHQSSFSALERLRYRPDTTTWIKWSRALNWEFLMVPQDFGEEEMNDRA